MTTNTFNNPHTALVSVTDGGRRTAVFAVGETYEAAVEDLRAHNEGTDADPNYYQAWWITPEAADLVRGGDVTVESAEGAGGLDVVILSGRGSCIVAKAVRS
jgi:hypothetical protein